MRKTLKTSLLVALTLLLASCESANSPTERYRLPPEAFNVWFLMNESGGIKQLSYSVHAAFEEMNSVKRLEAELISNGFVRCDAGEESWFRVTENAGQTGATKRHVRFYRGQDKYRLAGIGVDQVCEANGKCTQVTTLMFNSFPWWVFDREDTIKQICGNPS